MSVTDDAPTRERVATSILEHGPSTAAALAEGLGLTAAAVRRHLEQLLADGVVRQREPRALAGRGRGRPAKVFMITDAGRDTFAHAYDDLAADALRFLRESGGDEAVAAFARRRMREFAGRYRSLVEQADPADRPGALAEALSADGYAASVGSTPAGEQICQHHCPVAHVAGEFPQLCEAETEMFAELLDTHVQRLATIAHGDGVCTTHLPAARPTQSTQSTNALHTERVSP
ncbi:helix-turn-helix transcriptional regulator [Aeromicrobium sp. CF4.19]|uniref:helix-turn-helix transcriptional regulator n=1 Tax=Aeromicrobium sp. CF4.19 TaxID=3373082 RepID=UPI003EE7553D